MPDEPGWYPDPKREANFRFFDGRKWTKSVAADRPGGAAGDEGPVVGGLMVATFFTLFFVPVTYSLMRRRPPRELNE